MGASTMPAAVAGRKKAEDDMALVRAGLERLIPKDRRDRVIAAAGPERKYLSRGVVIR